MPKSPSSETSEPTPQEGDWSDLPSPPQLGKANKNALNDKEERDASQTFPPTIYPLSPERLAQRVQAWVVNPYEPFDKINRLPQVDLPPENIGYQSPFLPHKGNVIKPSL